MGQKVAFWLIPAAADRIFFQEVIDRLAENYAAFSFNPHVTIYWGEFGEDESLTEILEQAVRGINAFSLQCDRVLYTDQFTKTLFVQFHPRKILSQITESIRNHSQSPTDFTLNPHLSLMYKHLDADVKQSIASTISLPKTEVFFDEIQVLLTPDTAQTREDIENIKSIISYQLPGSCE
ncbi:2'-5' RNA ligase family protein [Scytonema millei]|uniref:Cyclic phosphodiesterase-like protein n=1 Tax=Scytonema millei VB511283 TaxID=1245923 RepID=A0A9X5EA11_9CYAN|nr:2'-5' RNA ligase family protein [Scytonema millei]NHC37987.1 cyclic phosphodiesterase-like protein [Scytonema millei VB511283]